MKNPDVSLIGMMCSCFWQDGQIHKVPGSKADIFKDKHLSLAQKRVLMRFVKNTSEAMQGSGPLKVYDSNDIVNQSSDWNE